MGAPMSATSLPASRPWWRRWRTPTIAYVAFVWWLFTTPSANKERMHGRCDRAARCR